MLDVIADFWKPVKKGQPQEKLQPELLQIGSSIGFGFVPQALLSGRRLHVSGINTYQFGEEKLTSFVLSQDNAPSVSMIVAESEGEQYLAISRPVPQADRARLFDAQELENVLSKPDILRLNCKDGGGDYKGWIVATYKREIQGLKGRLFKGDFRKNPLPDMRDGQEFEYTLLVSDSNEHALEIEKYMDGRMEIYSTIYRRMNDIGEITHPSHENARADIKLATTSEPVVKAQATQTEVSKPVEKPVEVKQPEPAAAQPEVKAPETKPAEAQKTENEMKAAVAAEKPLADIKPLEAKSVEIKPAEVTPAAVEPVVPVQAEASKPATPAAMQGASILSASETKAVMNAEKSPAAASIPAASSAAIMQPARNESVQQPMTAEAKPLAPAKEKEGAKLYVRPHTPEQYLKQEVKAVSTNGTQTQFDSDSIECDLRVANKIIDEAIRNEMRLTDIVRRIIELPVAYPESVQIPITLTDEDFALLAIRYGISSSDRNTIKRRIIEELNDFSGGGKKAAA